MSSLDHQLRSRLEITDDRKSIIDTDRYRMLAFLRESLKSTDEKSENAAAKENE